MTNQDNLFSVPIASLGDWTFDERITAVFPDMIQRSVPGYSNIISMISMLASRFAHAGTRVYDLGCSLGAVTLAIRRVINGCHIIAVDNSPAMVDHCRRCIEAFCTDSLVDINIDVIEEDICTVPIENASMVILNFTLQFLATEKRQTLMDRIYQGLNSGGILILSEKLSFRDKHIGKLIFDMHHDFKRANGYSELEIAQKNNMLENAMHTDSMEMHKIRLIRAGFTHAEIWFQCLNFGSLIAKKIEQIL